MAFFFAFPLKIAHYLTFKDYQTASERCELQKLLLSVLNCRKTNKSGRIVWQFARFFVTLRREMKK